MTKPKAAKGETFRHVVVLSDIQYPYHDKRAERAAMDFVARTQPDMLVQIGDFVDFHSLGSYRKREAPSDRMNLRRELKVAREKLKAWSACSRKAARRVLIAGNHEDRYDRYLADRAPELMDVMGSALPTLLDTAAAGWEFLAPYGAGMWLGKRGGIYAMHGQYCTKNAPDKHMMLVGASVIYGHTHRLKAIHQSNLMRTMGAYEIGCLCDMKTTPRNTPIVDWQHGFASVWVSDTTKRFHVDLIAITDGKFVYGGQTYGG